MKTADNPYQRTAASTRGPAMFYGYCPDAGHMRMMDYPDYVESIRKPYSDMYQNVMKNMQPWLEALDRYMPSPQRRRQGHCCEPEPDCHCTCCIRDSDAVEHTRCGETRLIPFTFENGTRRGRDVKLELSPFATSSGHEVGWDASFSVKEFKLPACGEQTVLLRVVVDCKSFSSAPNNDDSAANRFPSIDECKVAYATIRAEGCFIRPLVVAVAVLPNDCGAHRATCQCDCCC